MSGGGSSGGPSGSFGSSEAGTPCEDLTFQAPIASPQPPALTLSVGDLLSVSLAPGPPAVINLLTSDGDVAGSLITRIAALLRCIQAGFSYEAEVVTINAGDVQVKVRAA
jgi:hypothetical protein